MRSVLLVAWLTAVAGCATPARSDAPPAVERAPLPAASTTRLVVPARADRDCADLTDRAAAEALLRADPSDPHRLDADLDGVACEHLRRR